MAQDRFYSIHPRKGTICIMDKKTSDDLMRACASTLLVTKSTSHSKGGGMVRTVHDNILVGPDAIETPEYEDFSTAQQSIHHIFNKHQHTVPALHPRDMITYFAGVRAPTYEEDFVVQPGVYTQNIVHAAGIQSPGLTAAPAIAIDVAQMAVKMLRREKPVTKNQQFNPNRTPIVCPTQLTKAQRHALIQQNPDYGQIICRCEEVSLGEVLDAIHSPVSCDTVDGIKRRVRPGMGRCQGGFCGPLIAQVIAKEKGIPLNQVLKSGDDSMLVYGENQAYTLPQPSAQDAG